MASEVESENDIVEREEQPGEYANSAETSDVTTKLQEIDQEDSSLLDGALGEGDVEADESALSILDETGDGDGVQIEDPVRSTIICASYCCYCAGNRGNQGSCEGDGRGGREA